MLSAEMVDEEAKDDGDDEGGDPLAKSDCMEGKRGVLGGLLG